jgi:glutamyl-Q tRNA(Asp) synthetase
MEDAPHSMGSLPGTRRYRGRFAPSPTGPLHFGSLVAATASYLDARANHGAWLLRIEDVDRPRVVKGAADAILHALEAFRFEWDEAIVWQSTRDAAYRESLDRLEAAGWVYPCTCTRREIAGAGTVADDGTPRYPGTCRNGVAEGRVSRAWRLRVDHTPIAFEDRCQGLREWNLWRDVGDFVLLRGDGIFSYQLAVVVDDAFQEVTDVVRGADLLSSTPRQIHLQRALGLPTPRYLHIPVAEGEPGKKLSKQTLAAAIDHGEAGRLLHESLAFLGQQPPADLAAAPPREIWAWAIAHWNPERIPRTLALPAPARLQPGGAASGPAFSPVPSPPR